MRTLTAVLVGVLALASCSSPRTTSTSSGSPSSTGSEKEFASKVGQVEVGVTTKAEVLRLFGNDPTDGGKLPQTHSDVAGKLPPDTPPGEIERLIYIGAVDLATSHTETLFVYIDSAGKVCLLSYEE
jgi:hypothetical protein